MGNKLFKLKSKSKSKVRREEPETEKVMEDPCTPCLPVKTAEEVNEETRALLESAYHKLQAVKATVDEAEDDLLRAMTMLKHE